MQATDNGGQVNSFWRSLVYKTSTLYSVHCTLTINDTVHCRLRKQGNEEYVCSPDLPGRVVKERLKKWFFASLSKQRTGLQ